jgi:hypothetical protein
MELGAGGPIWVGQVVVLQSDMHLLCSAEQACFRQGDLDQAID